MNGSLNLPSPFFSSVGMQSSHRYALQLILG